MGKTLRKYRKSRTYDPVPPVETASPYAIHDGKGARHVVHVDNDLLSSPREFVPLDKLAPGHASPLRVLLTMMTTSVGAMAVVLPCAIREGGFVMSIFMVLFVAVVTHATRTRLVELGVEQGIYSFQGLAKLAFGPLGGFAVSVSQLGASAGLIVAYLLVAFQDIPIVLGHWLKMDFDQDGRPIVTPGTRVSPLLSLLADHYLFPEMLMLLVLLPFCLYAHSYARLRVSPALLCTAVAAAAFSAVVSARSEFKAHVTTASQGYAGDYLKVPSTVCEAFAIITMCICSQHHSFHTFYAMRDRCPTKFKRLSLMATLGSLAFGLSIGIGGYVSFLGATKGDVLHNYDFAGNQFVLIFWTALPLSAISCIAYEVIVSRHTMQFLCLPSIHKDEEKQDVLFADQHVSKTPSGEHAAVHDEQEQPSWTSQLFTAMALIVVAQIPIFLAQDIALVLALTGGLAGITLCFILPAACQLKLASPTGLCSDHVMPCLSIVIGVVAALAAVISTAVHGTPSDATS